MYIENITFKKHGNTLGSGYNSIFKKGLGSNGGSN
jgi:hypothetical protein